MKRQWKRYFRDGEVSPRAVAHLLGNLFYDTGYHTEYFFIRFTRGVRHILHGIAGVFVWVFTLLGSLLKAFFGTILEDVLAPWKQISQGMHNLRTMMRQEREAGSQDVAQKGLQYFKRGVRAYRDLIWNALAYLMPLGATAILVFTVYTVLSYTFALSVEYNGQMVGFIENETVYENAQNLVQQRLQADADRSEWEGEATFTISVVSEAALSDQAELANRIIATSSQKFVEATGVMVNGTLVGVTQDSELVNEALEQAQAPYQKPDQSDWSVRFRHEVEVIPGLYFTDTLISGQELVNRLTGAAPFTLAGGESITMNCLEVQQVHRITYQEEIPYETVTSQSAELTWGDEVIQQAGVAGQQIVTADVVYDMNGVELQKVVLSQEVISEPVTEVILYGTLNQYGGAVGKPGDGNFIWPVPGYSGISRGMGYGHRGVDITGAYGTTIVAADNGLVEISENGAGTSNWSYGLFVKIDHGNGYTTLYAHCSELLVSEGEYVVKGQPIARMGSTGNSSGNHCHLEFTENGVLTNPYRFVTPP